MRRLKERPLGPEYVMPWGGIFETPAQKNERLWRQNRDSQPKQGVWLNKQRKFNRALEEATRKRK